MSRFMDHVRYRAKAVVAACGIAVIGLAEWFVTSPDTAPALEAVVPPQLVPVVPLALGIAGTLVGYVAVYLKRNGVKPLPKTPGAPPVTELPDSPATSMIRVVPPGADGS